LQDVFAMASANLFALIDDIATLLDDVAVLSKVAAKKTAGVLGDDLALNAQQVAGVSADRELPVVWAVFKGSVINKLIIVPVALALSYFLPMLIVPLLMIGGAYLCFEGCEKLAHKFLHSKSEDAAHHKELVQAVADPKVDLVAFEKDKIKGAVRTDFILSAEIVVIALGAGADKPFVIQALSVAVIAAVMTVGVYGFVAGIVKLDDAGLYLKDRPGTGLLARCKQTLGRGLLRFAPVLMKTLSIVGTAAMFLVGGHILVEGWPWLHHTITHITQDAAALHASLAWFTGPLADALVGVAAGAVVLLGVTAVQRVMGRKAH
jgi:uncharacterized protein